MFSLQVLFGANIGFVISYWFNVVGFYEVILILESNNFGDGFFILNLMGITVVSV